MGQTARLRSVDALGMIEQRLPALTGASRRVGEAIVRDPWAVLGMTIYDVAAAAGVSLPSVTRFCRAVGYPGFRELVQGIAQSLGRIDSKDLAELEAPSEGAGGLPGLAARIVSRQIEALQDALRTIDYGAVEAAVEAIAGAHVVWVVGHGAAYVSAAGAAIKLNWAGVPATAATPDLFSNQLIALSKGDVVISISHQGRTRDVVEMQELARTLGATTIAISMVTRSPLASASDIAIAVLSPEVARTGTFLVAYNGLLAIADILAAAIVERRWNGAPPMRETVTDWMESSLRMGPLPEPRPGRGKRDGKAGGARAAKEGGAAQPAPPADASG